MTVLNGRAYLPGAAIIPFANNLDLFVRDFYFGFMH